MSQDFEMRDFDHRMPEQVSGSSDDGEICRNRPGMFIQHLVVTTRECAHAPRTRGLVFQDARWTGATHHHAAIYMDALGW